MLQVPFFVLHPCQTASFMGQLIETSLCTIRSRAATTAIISPSSATVATAAVPTNMDCGIATSNVSVTNDVFTFSSPVDMFPALDNTTTLISCPNSSDLIDDDETPSAPNRICNFVAAWLSLVGPVVGLKLPLDYFLPV